MAISWIKDKFIIQIVYTNVLNKDSTFEYFPVSGIIDPVDPPVNPPVDPTDPNAQQSSVGTIIASVVVLLIVFGLGTAGAVFVYKKKSKVVPVSASVYDVS